MGLLIENVTLNYLLFVDSLHSHFLYPKDFIVLNTCL